jgi:hypothetical protein
MRMKLPLSLKYLTPILHITVWGIILALLFYDGNPEKIVAIKPHPLLDAHVREWTTVPFSQTELTNLKIFGLIINIVCIGFFYLNAYFLYPQLLNKNKWWLYILCMAGIIAFLLNFNLVTAIHKLFSFPIQSEISGGFKEKRIAGRIIIVLMHHIY